MLRGFVRPSISQALADDALEQFAGAFGIANAKRRACVVSEIELGQIHRQMFMADMVIHAVDPALEDRKVILGCVHMRIAANIFLD